MRALIFLTALALSFGCSGRKAYQLSSSEMAEAATLEANGEDSAERMVAAWATHIDGLPVKTKGRILKMPERNVKVAPGKRKIIVIVAFQRKGLKNILTHALKDGRSHGVEIELEAALEPSKTYLVKGTVRGEFCAAWLEDKKSGKKITSEEARSYIPSLGGHAATAVSTAVLQSLFR